MAEGIPTYVVRSNSGVEQVCHRECLLLWIAADADTNNSVRSNSAITAHVANGPVDGDNHEGKVVPQDLDYRLSLAMFRTVIGPHHHKTYCFAEAPLLGVVQKGSWPGNLWGRGSTSDDWRYRHDGRGSTLKGTRRERPLFHVSTFGV